MRTPRAHLLLVLVSVILTGGSQGCDRGGGARARILPHVESLSGRWGAISAVAVDGCGLSASVIPVGFPYCDITQTGDTLAMTCGQWCGGTCVDATGTISGNDVNLASVRTVVLSPECSVMVSETDAATLSGGTLSGEATMVVTVAGNCAGQYPCLMKGPVSLTRFERGPGVIMPTCIMACP